LPTALFGGRRGVSAVTGRAANGKGFEMMDGTVCFLAELVGTALLMLLGNGVVANVLLERSGMKGGGSVQIAFAWGLAVLLPAFVFGATSGAHFNPALTIALAVDGSLAPSLVGWYVAGQMLGAAVGSFLVWALYMRHFEATEDGAVKRACFCAAPSVPCLPCNFLSEVVGTFVLVFAIKGIAQVPGIAGGVGCLLVFAVIVSVGMSLGGLTGYAINPARDLAPRIVYALLPMKNKAPANWRYAWVPVAGPVVGALAAVWLYKVFPWPAG
jgi:glycerol uptake facilitator protein